LFFYVLWKFLFGSADRDGWRLFIQPRLFHGFDR